VQIMLPVSVVYTMAMVGSIAGGYLPAIFMNAGRDVYTSRMRAMLTIAVFPLFALLAQPLGHISFWLPVIAIGIAASAHQAWSANLFTTVSDMFPGKTVASVTGIGGMAGGLGGVIITKVAGALFDHHQRIGSIQTGYAIMFAFCGIAYLLGWMIMKMLVPSFRRISNL